MNVDPLDIDDLDCDRCDEWGPGQHLCCSLPLLLFATVRAIVWGGLWFVLLAIAGIIEVVVLWLRGWPRMLWLSLRHKSLGWKMRIAVFFNVMLLGILFLPCAIVAVLVLAAWIAPIRNFGASYDTYYEWYQRWGQPLRDGRELLAYGWRKARAELEELEKEATEPTPLGEIPLDVPCSEVLIGAGYILLALVWILPFYFFLGAIKFVPQVISTWYNVCVLYWHEPPFTAEYTTAGLKCLSRVLCFLPLFIVLAAVPVIWICTFLIGLLPTIRSALATPFVSYQANSRRVGFAYICGLMQKLDQRTNRLLAERYRPRQHPYNTPIPAPCTIFPCCTSCAEDPEVHAAIEEHAQFLCRQ